MANAARVVQERPPAPILKWVGGKRQLLPEIQRALPAGRIERYFEPFVGGAAVFFDLARQDRIGQAVLCDTNAELVGLYSAVRARVDDVIKAARAHRNDADYFYSVRAQDPATLSPAERAARTIFMNRCGYNGLYRVNSTGRFNVPFGRYTNPTICDADGLRAASKALQRAELRIADFKAGVHDAKRGDVLYFDPPYVPLSTTSSFTGYTRGGFTLEDQARLRDVARSLKKRGATVVLSNSSAPAVYDLYRLGFKCREVAATRLINCNAGKRGAIAELLIT